MSCVLGTHRYLTETRKDVLGVWLARLNDNRARARVLSRLNRLSVGSLGDCKPLREGVWELRIDYGPGYRVYYSDVDRASILLLCGGDKHTQLGDIARAVR